MNGLKEIIFKDIINSIVLKIEEHIKENSSELFFKLSSVKRVLTENYISIFISKNEYAANEFLEKIDNNFSLYHKNDFTKGIDFIRKEINSSIESLFSNSAKIASREANKIQKERLKLLIQNNISGDYYLEFEDNKMFIQIDSENNKFKIINFDGYAIFFYNKRDLINKVYDVIGDKSNSNLLHYRFYNRKEYVSYFNNNKTWKVNSKNIFREIINDIKERKQINVNENISIELNESYSYKNIFIIRDKIENTEKVLHIYVDDIEEAFTVAKSKYDQIMESGEHLLYKIGTGWFITKIKNNIVKKFSQYTDLLKPLERVLSRVNLIASTETNYDFSHIHVLTGLCYGLSLNYLVEVRNSGLEGGNKYLFWLKESISSYQSKKEFIADKLDSILFNSIQEYEILNLIKEIKSIIFSQHFQMDRLGEKSQYFVFDTFKPLEYSQILEHRGLKKSHVKKIVFNIDNIHKHLEHVMNSYNDYYAIIAFKDHAIAITYKRYSENNYKFSLFDSNSELLEYSNVRSMNEVLEKKMDFYGSDDVDDQRYIIFDEYTKSEISNYRSVWDCNNIEINKGIAENIKKIGFSLPFKDNITGRIVHYSKQGDLILELKKENILIEVIVKDTYVDEGVYLVKNYIDDILENSQASKIILNKNDDNSVDIVVDELNNFQEIKKQNGYIEFNDIYYRDLIEINSHIVKGKKAKELKEIVSLIDRLKGNIYFDKLIASFSLINKINIFNSDNKSISLIEILNKVKNKLENKLFYDRLNYGKEKLMQLAEKNSLVAAKFYQLMVNEISDGTYGVSNFIYNQIIESPYLSIDKKRCVGVEGYDYTIEFHNSYQYVNEIVESINIPELKNTILIEDESKLHLKENYKKLSEYRSDKYVNKLLSLIETEIDINKGDKVGYYSELYFDLFRNNQFTNRMIMHEICQLENYFNNGYREHNYSYHPSNFYIDKDNPVDIFEYSFSKNKNEIDSSYLLFDDNKNNFKFLFLDNKFFSNKNIDNVIVDSINSFYQDDIIIYFYNGVKSEDLAIYLNDNPEISAFLDYCLKNRIRVIATGSEDNTLFHHTFIKQKNDVDTLQNIINENKFFNERTIIFAKKEKLLSYQSGDFFVEGIAQRLNMPIYQIIDNKVSLLQDYIIVKPIIERQYIDKPLLMGAMAFNIMPLSSNYDDDFVISNEEKIEIENNQIAKKIYQVISSLYPNYRENEEFKLGYDKEIKKVIVDYSDKIILSDILNYITLNRYDLNMYQIGSIINKVDAVNVEYHRKELKRISNEIIKGDISIKKAIHQYIDELSVSFKTIDKKKLENKITQVIYDPLMSNKFNQYLLGEISFEQWHSLDLLTKEHSTLIEKANQAIKIIHSIYDNPVLIKNLSSFSENLLTSFFDENRNGILYRSLLDNISIFKNYKKIINSFQNIITMVHHKMIPDSLPPAKALEQANDLNPLELLKVNNQQLLNKETITISDFSIDKQLLINLGAKINGRSLDSVDLNTVNKWESKLSFDPYLLNDYFFSFSGDEKDKSLISLFRYLLNNKKDKVKYLLSGDTNRIDYLAASERLIKINELGHKEYQAQDWDVLRKVSLNIPRHMKIISKIGYANITFGMWQSINTTFMLAEQLNNPLLTMKERKEIINNLAIMWSEMAYNGLSEMIEITLAKGLLKYRHNPLEYVNKISTRIGVGLNILSIGFDIYNAYDNFSRISDEDNKKRQIDYIVNGSLAVVSGLVTLGVSIAMLAGSTLAGPIGIVAGAVIALATSIYNATRLIEEAKVKVHFTLREELDNGFYAFLMGDLLPNKKNEIVYLETETQLEEMIDKKAISYLEEIKKQNYQSRYFYTNEKQVYQEYYYYKVLPNLIGKTIDSILNPLGDYVAQRMSQNLSQEEAEKIAALSYHLRAEKTEYKYYLPKEAIATNETLIFDIDFYVKELKRYTLDIIPDGHSPIFDDVIDSNFIRKMKTTRENSILLLGENKLISDLIKSNKNKKYYSSGWNENEVFHFNTHNGNDIIAAPSNTKNTFDIYNGTKRLSGGNKEDIFNLFASESPLYASRFYGRGGSDTLRIVKTTNKYQGYEVNLLDNYVKFKPSEEQTNSQSFHSKLFLYQENGRLYSKKIVDSMPNIILQNHSIIAYLDSIENVIGSEFGNDTLYGNHKANYLDGMGGADLLYGLGGNDTLVLQEGYAEGGDGNDNYLILRASLEKNYNIQFETIINEKSEVETSLIRLNYYFDEIHSIRRQGKDIVLYIKVNDGNQYNESIYHLITLRNVYENKENNSLVHRYTLTTMDGFILTASKANKDNVLYDFSYIGKYNNTEDDIQSLYVDDNNRSLSLSYLNKTKNINLLPQLRYSGFSSGENLRFGLQGDFQDNHYFGITKNSIITLSSGSDSYQIKTFLASNRNDKINILFPDNREKLSYHDISSFFLSDISGFDLMFSNNVISHRYHPDFYLKLAFEPSYINTILEAGMKLRFIDKDNRIFTLPTKESGQRLLVPITDLNLAITAEDNVLMIPESLTLNKETLSEYSLSHSYSPLYSLVSQGQLNQAIDLLSIIEPMEGNDIVVNRNKNSSVINGGLGDDHIVVNHGHHILIAGEGNDNLNAGSGNDLLISEFGDDHLTGGAGNNVYIVKKRQSKVTIYDEGNSSHLFISGLSKHEKLIASQVGDDMQYKTQDNQFILTVKAQQDKTVSITEKKSMFSAQSLAAIIQEMALFNEQQLKIMQDSELVLPLAWSPLSAVVKHWEL
ncbi:RTX toxin [Proteus faecis]|uniref:RTX toxin n=5 Tax=Proteus TaxID=583 RepID=A0AAW7CV54_9GAMM|nr:RTX toxin [Proteus faecis]MDL5168322.1 RTX toxin [Proteus faecis]MDL5276275.1 RTX toxin [Proteus faecis]MDL5279842.1 RTX toxin [Proteus faecis]MDL5308845.1 RTX toxin [Proteus faecis]MDL5312438.1 RTX toxin [Proteus faecis]